MTTNTPYDLPDEGSWLLDGLSQGHDHEERARWEKLIREKQQSWMPPVGTPAKISNQPLREQIIDLLNAKDASVWLRESVVGICLSENHARLPMEAIELIRIVSHHEKIEEDRTWGEIMGEDDDVEEKESEFRVSTERLGLLIEGALAQYMGLPVDHADLDYNRFLRRYMEEPQAFSLFHSTGTLPSSFRAKDLNNPPYWFCQHFEVPECIEPLDSTLDAELKRIHQTPGFQPWLLRAIDSLPRSSMDSMSEFKRESCSLLRLAVGIAMNRLEHLKSYGQRVDPNPGPYLGKNRNHFRYIPPADILGPRKHYLNGSHDLPFLARFLEQGDKERFEVDDEWYGHHVFRRRNEAEKFIRDNDFETGINVLSREDALERLVEAYWRFRRIVASKGSYCRLSIGSAILKDHDEAPRDDLWRFGANLRHPFFPDQDPLLSQPEKIQFFKWEYSNPEILFCPLCGPISDPAESYYCSSPASWRNRAGREEKRLLCPFCLGEFHCNTMRMS